MGETYKSQLVTIALVSAIASFVAGTMGFSLGYRVASKPKIVECPVVVEDVKNPEFPVNGINKLLTNVIDIMNRELEKDLDRK